MREDVVDLMVYHYNKNESFEVKFDPVQGADYYNQIRYELEEELLHLSSGLTTDESYSYQIKIKDAEHLKAILEQLV